MIESLVGHPYVEPHGCFTVVHKALAMLGKPVPDYTVGLPEHAQRAELQQRLREHCVEVEAPERGDLVVLRILGEPVHIGIMVNAREMLHCVEKLNACIERLDSPRWRGRVDSYWRL